MMREVIKNFLGLSFNGFGILWAFFDKILCGKICRGVCEYQDNFNCALLLLFVGIIFIVCGYAIIKRGNEKKARKLKRRFLRYFFK